MTIALKSPTLLGGLISVDNAPVTASLGSNFSKYVQGLQEIESAKVAKQIEADEILKIYEKVAIFCKSCRNWSTRLNNY